MRAYGVPKGPSEVASSSIQNIAANGSASGFSGAGASMYNHPVSVALYIHYTVVHSSWLVSSLTFSLLILFLLTESSVCGAEEELKKVPSKMLNNF